MNRWEDFGNIVSDQVPLEFVVSVLDIEKHNRREGINCQPWQGRCFD